VHIFCFIENNTHIWRFLFEKEVLLDEDDLIDGLRIENEAEALEFLQTYVPPELHDGVSARHLLATEWP
jgi:hypothetical protein